jgi:hypothetical protein
MSAAMALQRLSPAAVSLQPGCCIAPGKAQPTLVLRGLLTCLGHQGRRRSSLLRGCAGSAGRLGHMSLRSRQRSIRLRPVRAMHLDPQPLIQLHDQAVQG